MAGIKVATGELMGDKKEGKRVVKKNMIPAECIACRREQCPLECVHLEVYTTYLRNKELDT